MSLTKGRFRNVDWRLVATADGRLSNEHATLAVLMDIRDELQALNRRLGVRGPLHDALARIDRRLRKRFGPLTNRRSK